MKMKTTMRHAIFSVVMFISLIRGTTAAELKATDFGVTGDGRTDDGPAILSMVNAARKLDGQPVKLSFPQDKIIRAATGENGYLLPLARLKNIVIAGNGSTFLLDPRIRMADLGFSRNIGLKDFKVDYTTTMFIETTIQTVDPKLGYVDVTPCDASEADQIGGPTRQDGEQWFGGFIWCGKKGRPGSATHYSVKSTRKLDDGRVRVFHGEGAFTRATAAAIVPGATAFSVPRAGVAHRHGPGALFQIHDATDATLEKIAVWGAPWFAFSIYRCEGVCRFTDVDVIPKPGATRLMSACRDAFHVTANRAKLVFDGCDTNGTGDDDYNFCVLTSAIRKVLSPTEIVIRQKFPIQYNPMRSGETLMIMNADNSVLGSAVISTCNEKPLNQAKSVIPGEACPDVTIRLDKPVAGLVPGLTVWSKEAANPDTTMFRCNASFSIRMQTSLKIERCRFVCYNSAYGMSPDQENVEGPGPDSLWIKDSAFLTGRGAGLVVQCAGNGPIARTRIERIHIEGCTFNAPLRVAKARFVTLLDNRFQDEVKIGGYESLHMRGNTRMGHPFSLERPDPPHP